MVAIPTETVYGLAGWIFSEAGLNNIFSVKERPFFDPLIVHVDSLKRARELALEWTVVHDILATHCWPGPLTLIAKKHSKINPLITAGLESVALRCPNHPQTLKLLASIEGGLAAPSANKFGKTSPTTSFHVAEEFHNDVPILEGGECSIGIESTVVGITLLKNEYLVEIYRPGYFTARMISQILEENQIKASVQYAQSPVAPGQLQHHYMPRIPLVIVPENFNWDKDRLKVESALKKTFSQPKIWEQPKNAHLASRELYSRLRQFDQEGYDIILTAKLPTHSAEEWLGIWNRLHKAQSLTVEKDPAS